MTHIRHLARQLRQQYGPRDPFLLCEQMDIAVLYTDLPLITKGIFFSISGRRVINLSLSLAEQEKTAVCAHELGHAVLHPANNYPFLSSNTNLVLGRYEREADYFSACLLLDDLEAPSEDCTIEQLAMERNLPLQVVELWAQSNAAV